MDRNLIFVLIMYWVISAIYVMYHQNRRYTLGLDVIIGAILLGPILALFIKDDEHFIDKHHYIEENNNDRQRRWFQTRNLIDRERLRSARGFSIPPPPPISQKKQNKKDFKFFQK